MDCGRISLVAHLLQILTTPETPSAIRVQPIEALTPYSVAVSVSVNVK